MGWGPGRSLQQWDMVSQAAEDPRDQPANGLFHLKSGACTCAAVTGQLTEPNSPGPPGPQSLLLLLHPESEPGNVPASPSGRWGQSGGRGQAGAVSGLGGPARRSPGAECHPPSFCCCQQRLWRPRACLLPTAWLGPQIPWLLGGPAAMEHWGICGPPKPHQVPMPSGVTTHGLHE